MTQLPAALTLVCSWTFACGGAAAGARVDGSVDLTSDAGTLGSGSVLSRMSVAQVPGLAAVAVKDGRVVFARGYGIANFARGVSVTPDTLFNLASLSKTVNAVALMQSVDRGRLGLDQDVSTSLPFPVENPNFPGVALTPRMLLDHTSSIRDSAVLYQYVVVGEDSPIPLGAFMRGYLTPGGAYNVAHNWAVYNGPGAVYAYSNAGADLAGELVEAVSGLNLQQYCEANLFRPLGMGESSWFLSGLDPAHLAMPYTVDASGAYRATGFYCYPDYPNGQLRSSANQMARFLMMFMQGGVLDGARVLSASAAAQMRVQQPHSTEGLSWEYFTMDGHALIGHSGVDQGVSTDMWFDPTTNAGFVVLTNGDVYLQHFSEFESSGSYPSASFGSQINALLSIESDLLSLAEAQ